MAAKPWGMGLLFTLLAERYKRGSVLITSNLPVSKWESIFKEAMTTAAIDSQTHHGQTWNWTC